MKQSLPYIAAYLIFMSFTSLALAQLPDDVRASDRPPAGFHGVYLGMSFDEARQVAAANGWKRNAAHRGTYEVQASNKVGNFACNQEGKCLGLRDVSLSTFVGQDTTSVLRIDVESESFLSWTEFQSWGAVVLPELLNQYGIPKVEKPLELLQPFEFPKAAYHVAIPLYSWVVGDGEIILYAQKVELKENLSEYRMLLRIEKVDPNYSDGR